MTPRTATRVGRLEPAAKGRARLDDSARVNTVTRTLRLKVKSECYPWLDIAAMEVNTV
jgi:hypothetical protein